MCPRLSLALIHWSTWRCRRGRQRLPIGFFPWRQAAIPRGRDAPKNRHPTVKSRKRDADPVYAPSIRNPVKAATGAVTQKPNGDLKMKIGTFTKQDDSYTGTINTLSIVAEITLKPADKSSDSAPDFRVYSGDGEVGAAWNKVSKEDREYVFVKIDDPMFANAVLANLVEQDDEHALIWQRK